MFLLPAYDPTAMAMLGFGVLAAAAARDGFSASGASVRAFGGGLR
jgi:hypothetical protein